MRLHQGQSDAMPVLVKRVFAPLQTMYQSMMREGIASGELIDVDWMQIHLATLGANVFYFLAAPVWRMLMPFEPFAPDVLAARRRAVVEFLGHGGLYRSRAWQPNWRPACLPTRRCLNCRALGTFLGEPMNARNRVFMILGLLTLGSLVWYLLTARTSGDLEIDRHGRCQRSAGEREDTGAHPDAECG